MQGLKYDDMLSITAHYTTPYELVVLFFAKGAHQTKKNSVREKDQFDVMLLKALLKTPPINR